MNTWTYDELTDAAEKRIKNFLDKERDSKERLIQLMNRNSAYGVYMLWLDLTYDWRNDVDTKKLEALLQSKPPI